MSPVCILTQRWEITYGHPNYDEWADDVIEVYDKGITIILIMWASVPLPMTMAIFLLAAYWLRKMATGPWLQNTIRAGSRCGAGLLSIIHSNGE